MRGKIHNRTAAASDHFARRRLRAQEGADDIDVEHRAQHGKRRVQEVFLRADTGIVDRNVGRPELAQRKRDHRVDLGGLAYVGATGGRSAARRDNLCAYGPHRIHVEVRAHHARAFLREPPCRRRTNAGSGAGDDDNLVRESLGHDRALRSLVKPI